MFIENLNTVTVWNTVINNSLLYYDSRKHPQFEKKKLTKNYIKNHPRSRREWIIGKLSILIEIWSTSLVLSWDKIKEITTSRTGHRLINFTDNFSFWINYLRIEMMIMSSHEELSARWLSLDNCWKRNHC